MLTSSTERKLCSGGETTVGYNSRTHTTNATATACAPVLKTNSLQGVLVFGRSENSESCKTGELISVSTRQFLKTPVWGQSFSDWQRGPRDCTKSRRIWLTTQVKPARQRPFCRQLGRVYSLIFQSLALTVSATSPACARKSKKFHRARECFTSGTASR